MGGCLKGMDPKGYCKKFPENFCESHQAPIYGHVREGIKEGLREGGVWGEGYTTPPIVPISSRLVSVVLRSFLI